MTEQPPSANQPPPQPGPPPGYGPPARPGYGPPPPGYGPPPPGYPPPPPGFGPPPPGYPSAGYGYPPQQGWGPGYAAPLRPTNTMAILALVFIFVFAPLSVVFGLIARSQIKQTGEAGDGMALAGIIVGALSIVALVVFIGLLVAIVTSVEHGNIGPRVYITAVPVPG